VKELDAYTFRARVVPVLVVVLPPLVLLGGGVISGARLGIVMGMVTTLLAAVAGQLGRDRGKALEPGLWAEWGGSPTLQRLRYRGNAHDRVARLHARIEHALADALPDLDQERDDQASADERYDEVTKRLIALTRNHDKYPLVFAENVNYGQRRNLLGLRDIGVAVAATTLLIAFGLLLVTGETFSHRAARFGPGVAVSLAALLFWLAIVTRSWVRVPAEAYADRLLEAVDLIEHDQRAQPGS
jgi:hypothetical protein